MPPEAKTGTQIFVVGQRRSVQGEHVEDRVAGIGAGPKGEHVFLAHPGSQGGGELLANWELVVELVDAHGIGSGVFLEGDLQGGETTAKGILIGIKVAGPQHGAQQIFA